MVDLSTIVLEQCLKQESDDDQEEKQEEIPLEKNDHNNNDISDEEDDSIDDDRYQEHKNIKSFQVKVKLDFNSNTFFAVLDKLKKGNKFVMFETVDFWLPEFYTSKALSSMIQNNTQISFEDQILLGSNPSENQFPEYEQNQTKKKEVMIKEINSFISGNPQLDEEQQNPLYEMLNKNLCFVEGPPGTGKSFIAKQAVLNLLQSYSRVDCKGKKPILILSHKNVSLDALLKSILESNQSSILRLGKSKDSSLSQFGLKTLLKTSFISKKGEIQEKQLNQLVESLKNPVPNPKTEDRYKDLAKLVNIQFSRLGVDLPSLLFKSFMKHFLPDISIEENSEEIAAANALLFEQWIANNFGTSILEKLPEKYHKIDEKLELFETFQEINGSFAVSQFFEKPLINYSLEDPNERFCLRNNRVVDVSSQLISRLTSARDFYDFTRLKTDVLNLTYSKVKQQLFHKLFCYYKQEYSEVQRLNTFLAGKVVAHKFRERKVIGMTLTRAMIIFKYLQIIRPEIVIIDEASEVKESQIACILQPYVKHVIQIGDYKQLSPIFNDIQFTKDFNVGNSQFERVITKLKNQSSRLKVQRRMAPQLSEFVRLVYGKQYYLDHASVKNKIPEISVPYLALIDHKYREKIIKERHSMTNTFEAYFCIQYVLNLIKTQNIQCPQISVLSFYSAQVKLIQQEWNKEKQSNFHEIEDDKDISINTVDEFQGKEGDYIILSCGRSNDKNAIGFLSSPQRINVAFSRARLSLTMICNLELLYQNNDDWKKRIELAKKQRCIVNSQNIQNYPLIQESYQQSKKLIEEAKQTIDSDSSRALENDEISNKFFSLEVSNYLNETEDNSDINNNSNNNNNNKSSEISQSICSDQSSILQSITIDEQEERKYFSALKDSIRELENKKIPAFRELEGKMRFMEKQLEKLHKVICSQTRNVQLNDYFLESLIRSSNIQEFYENLHVGNQDEDNQKFKTIVRTILFRQTLDEDFENSFRIFKIGKKTFNLNIREYPQTDILETASNSLLEAGSKALQSTQSTAQIQQQQRPQQNNEEEGVVEPDDLEELVLSIVGSVNLGNSIYQDFSQPYIFQMSTSCSSIAVKGKWIKGQLNMNIFAQSEEILDQWSGLQQVESAIQEVMNMVEVQMLKVVFLLKMEDNSWYHYIVDLQKDRDIQPVSIRLKEHAIKIQIFDESWDVSIEADNELGGLVERIEKEKTSIVKFGLSMYGTIELKDNKLKSSNKQYSIKEIKKT